MYSLTKELARHAAATRYEDIPASVTAVQKQSLADALACMTAATTLGEGTGVFTDYALAQCSLGNCTLLGSEKKTTAALAALANGALIHALDYEDSHEKALVHPNSVSTCALLALAEEEEKPVSGRQLLTALVIASDLTCRLDLSIREDLLKYGWNMPPVHGGMGAVFGGGNLLGLTPGEIEDALALQMSQSVSPGQASLSAGSVVRTVRDGFAAQAAVQSLQLAKRGISARFDGALEGKLGYFHAFARDNYDPERVTADLGKVFESEEISFKPWPSCRATHTAIEGISALFEREKLTAEDIEEVHYVMQEVGRMVFEPKEAKYRPQAAGIAKFSLPFITGALVCDGEISLKTFEAGRLSDPAVLAVADRVTYAVDESLTKAENKKTVITVKTREKSYTVTADHPLGCRENPLSEEALKKKFTDCFEKSCKGCSGEKAERIFSLIMHLEELEDIRTLTALL